MTPHRLRQRLRSATVVRLPVPDAAQVTVWGGETLGIIGGTWFLGRRSVLVVYARRYCVTSLRINAADTSLPSHRIGRVGPAFPPVNIEMPRRYTRSVLFLASSLVLASLFVRHLYYYWVYARHTDRIREETEESSRDSRLAIVRFDLKYENPFELCNIFVMRNWKKVWTLRLPNLNKRLWRYVRAFLLISLFIRSCCPSTFFFWSECSLIGFAYRKVVNYFHECPTKFEFPPSSFFLWWENKEFRKSGNSQANIWKISWERERKKEKERERERVGEEEARELGVYERQ